MLTRSLTSSRLVALVAICILATGVDVLVAQGISAVARLALGVAATGTILVIVELFPLKTATLGLVLIVLSFFVPDLAFGNRAPERGGVDVAGPGGRFSVVGPARFLLCLGGILIVIYAAVSGFQAFDDYNSARKQAKSSLDKVAILDALSDGSNLEKLSAMSVLGMSVLEMSVLEIQEMRLKWLTNTEQNLQIMVTLKPDDEDLLKGVKSEREITASIIQSLKDARSN